jgi:signal transduction histidine kinase/CheY-like chemotaxis protein/putative methionine-R-sulfoxide reductase with GAF domain
LKDTARPIEPPAGTGRVVRLLYALNAAAASLQQSVHSEDEVFRVFKEQSISIGLVCSLSLLTEDRQKLVIRAAAAPSNILSKVEKLAGMSAEGFSFEIDKVDSFQKVVNRGQPLYLNQNSGIVSQLVPPFLKNIINIILNTMGQIPIIMAPIFIDGRVEGVLTIAGRSLTPDDLPGIEAFANHLAIAIHNSRLFAATRRQAQALGLLDRVRTALASEIELPTLIKTVVEAISETFGYTLVSLYLLEGDELAMQHQVGYDNVIERIPISSGVSGRVVRSGLPVLLQDVHDDPTFLGAIANIVSEVCVPLLDQGEVVGTLNVESIGDFQLGEDDLRLMVALSEHVNVAIRRARLYEALQQREKRLRKQREALMVLATNTALGETGLKSALHEILKTTARTLDVERAGVWIIDESKKTLTCQGLYQKGTEQYASGETLPMTVYPTYLQALEENRAIAANNCCVDSRTAELAAAYYKPNGITSVLNAPIRLNGKMVGAVSHEHVGGERLWENEEEVFAGSIADLVALLLEAQERHRTEEALRQAQKLESLGVLAGGVAHDFNNLLVAMLGQTSLALGLLEPENLARPHIEKATNAARRAADLTRQLLAYSGRGQFEKRPLHLNTLIKENLHLLQVAIPKNVQLESTLFDPLPTIDGDNGQIQQIIMNLIINAAESLNGKPGTVTISTGLKEVSPEDTSYGQFTGRMLPSRNYVGLNVHDTGLGMGDETLARIFDPFFTTKGTGRGLGLAAVLGIIRGHHGGLQVETQSGEGTTFKLLFPAGDKMANDAAVEPHRHIEQTNGYILVIDDEEPVREAITDILDLEGISVISAENGTTGIQLYLQHQTDVKVVLLDLSMPGLSGEETLRALREINPSVQVILSSGYSEKDAVGRFSDLGLTAFLQKPYEAETLISLLGHHLRV